MAAEAEAVVAKSSDPSPSWDPTRTPRADFDLGHGCSDIKLKISCLTVSGAYL